MIVSSTTPITKRMLVSSNRLLQVAALVYRVKQGKIEYLLITSRGTGRWVIPKGWPMPQKTLSQAAMKEAVEEAGIRGVISENEIGRYSYVKPDVPPSEINEFEVRVYALFFSHQEKKWPERHQRIAQWLDHEQAENRVHEPELKQIIENFEQKAKQLHGLIN